MAILVILKCSRTIQGSFALPYCSLWHLLSFAGPDPWSLRLWATRLAVALLMSFFPYLGSRHILIAPSGFVCTKHISKVSKIVYSNGLMPELLLEQIVKKRLKGQRSVAVTVKETPTMTAKTPIEQDISKENHEQLPLNGNVGTRPDFPASDAVVSQ